MSDKKYLIMPDSFKGTLSAVEVCDIMSKAILEKYKNAQITKAPIADGGEGTVETMLQILGGETVKLNTCGVFLGDKIESFYGVTHDKKSAVIEIAAACGLPQAGENKNPLTTTSYGAGELILDAIKNGAKKIYVGLGGSATHDVGCGILSALGVSFKNEKGEEFIPTGGSLADIKEISFDAINKALKEVEIICMCDVVNKAYGEKGAAHVYGPQKGADSQMVKMLDDSTKYVCDMLQEHSCVNLSEVVGGGAAGAMGIAFSLIGAKMISGIELVLKLLNFDEIVSSMDCIFTGEGRIDSQSLQGKVLSGILEHSKNTPVIAVVGAVGDDLLNNEIPDKLSIFSINKQPKPFAEVKSQSAENLLFTMQNIVKLI